MKNRFRLKRVVSMSVIVISSLLGATLSADIMAPPIQKSYSSEQVADNVYVIHGPSGFPNPKNQGFMNNPGFVVTEAGVVVIDAGSSVQVGRMVLEHIAEITDKPVVAAFATHIHGDHWLGNQAILEIYPEAKMYAHPGLIEAANNGDAETWVNLMASLTDGATEGTTGVVPELIANNGDTFEFGAYKLSIHHKGIAHTNTDIAILLNPGNVLFTGDLIFNQRTGRMDDGSFLGLMGMLEFLESLNPDVVVPGHGKTGKADMIAEASRFHADLYGTVETLYEEGLSDFEMKDQVVEKLKAYHHYDGFDDNIGRLISLGYLEIEENNF